MSASSGLQVNGNNIEILHPRARKVLNSYNISLQQNGHMTEVNGVILPAEVERSSGTATPVPPGAAPSIKATSSARQQIRALNKRRLFPTVEYAARVSHFDHRSEYSNFRGFFVLFWIGLVIMVMTSMLRNVKETGVPFNFRQRDVFMANIYELAFSDLAMTASTLLCVPLHRLYARSSGLLRWKTGGIWVQSVFQAVWLLYWVDWPFLRHWTWTAQVFFTLHLLTLFMKMHSYAFYNGHLSETKRRLHQLDTPETASTAAATKYPTSTGRLKEIHADHEQEEELGPEEALTQLREDLAVELTSPLGNVTYAQNSTIANFLDFLCCPTLCYELEYPRTEHVNWLELFYKTLAVFGCIFLLTLISDEFIIPVLSDSAIKLQTANSFSERALVICETISTLLFPFMVTFLLVFLVIFEYVCGAFAEITCFADRQFYSDWWNSCDWLEFSREWNIPVHNFFRRHVYMTSRTRFSQPIATVITFLVSAAAHELVMGCITKKVRGYGFFAMMLQMPFVVIQRSPWIRGRTLLNNVLFWCSIILGLSMMCALYVLV